MPLAQPSLYGEDEEDLYSATPLRSSLCPPSTLNHSDRHGVMCCRKVVLPKVVLDTVRLRMSSCTFGEVNTPRKVFM
jgi:hypothetical protein